MQTTARLTTLVSLVLIVIVTLATLPAAARENPPGPLHPKSAAGLMPPAYGLDPDAPAPAAAPAIAFLNTPINTTIGSWPQVLATGDFDANGRAEAAVATAEYFDPEHDDSLHLLGWNGGAFAGLQQAAAGSAPEAAVAADLDRDGAADIALALAGVDALAVYTQTTTKQPLSGPELLPLAGAPDALASGDFDGDLYADVAAVAPLSDTITIYASSADELLSEAGTLAFPTDGYSALAAGDLNHDGQDDLVALRGSGYASDSAVVFLQDQGTFPISYTLSPQTGGYLPHSLAVGDVTGDGLDDLVVTAGGNTPKAYLNVFVQGMIDPPDVPATFGLATTPVVYPAYHLPGAVEIADLNHDGREDVVLLNDSWRALSVHIQNADGTLDAHAVAEVPYASRFRPDALALADFNGDGGLDAALVERTPGLSVLLNTIAAPTAAIVAPAHGDTIFAGTRTISGTATADAVRVEVRVKGFSNWQPATLNAGVWQADIALPSHSRDWWIEARAIAAAEHVQSPPARHRVRVSGRVTDGLVVLYDFEEDDGETVHDVSGVGEPLDLAIDNPAATTWNAGGLVVDAPTIIASPAAATKVIDALTESNELTVEAWVAPANAVQDGPARIVSLSRSSHRHNFSLGQGLWGTHPSTLYSVRLATTEGPNSGSSPMTTPEGVLSTDLTHVMLTRDTEGTTRIYVDGVEQSNALFAGDFSNWNASYRLALANDVDVARPWLGAYHLTAIYDRALSADEVNQNFAAGPYTNGAPPANAADAAPSVDGLTINNRAAVTATRDVSLTVDASGNDIRSVLFMEYAYDQANNRWQLVQRSDWLAYGASPATYAWQLRSLPGVVYMQAWAVNAAGMVSHFPYQSFINYVPASDMLAQGDARVYRYTLDAGASLTARLTSLSGDADLYVWAPEEEAAQPRVSDRRSGVDEVSLIAPIGGVYQVEVYGYTTATYTLTVTQDPALNARGLTQAAVVAGDKPLRDQPLISLEDAPTFAQPNAQRRMYLPLVIR